MATDAQLNLPRSVIVSSSNQVYISELGGHRIRKIDRHGMISTIAGNGERGYNGDDQLSTSAQLYFPCGLFVTNDEQVLFTDKTNHRARKIDLNGIISFIPTGNVSPDSIFVHNEEVYFTDGWYQFCKIQSNRTIEIIAGNAYTGAQLNVPCSVVVLSSDQVYISDLHNHCIRKIDPNGIISTIAGTSEEGYNRDNQLATSAQLFYPIGLFVTEDDEVLFGDMLNNRVRMVDRNGIISTIAGDGYNCQVDYEGFNGDGKLATFASLYHPSSVFQYGNEIFIADREHQRIRMVDRNGIIVSIAKEVKPHSIFVHHDEVYFTNGNQLCKLRLNGNIDTIAGIANEIGFHGDDMVATECKLNQPSEIFVDDDSQIYIADTENHCIRMIDRNGIMRRVVGGTGTLGYSGDVSFDFNKYPHVGPRRRKPTIRPFPHAYHDLIVTCQGVEMDSFDQYQPAIKKTKY